MSILLLAADLTAVPAPGLVRLGHAQRVGRYRVTPVAVVEDSRCPMNARCVWAGRVVVRATVSDGHRRTVSRLTLGEPAATGIILDSVTPERMARGPRAPLRYRFHFAAATLGT